MKTGYYYPKYSFSCLCTVHSYKFVQQGKRLELPTNGTQAVCINFPFYHKN
jgi:hypothetical protein